MRLTGYAAIEFAEKQNLRLSKHPDRLDGPREGLTVAEAEAIAATLPTDCYRCLWTRGWVATTARDWARADREFAAALALAPSIPLAYAAWGESLAARGDLDRAAAKFRQSAEQGPHYADAQKSWGDLLAGEGRWKDALAKYDAALKFAPAWVELHQARDAAARRV